MSLNFIRPEYIFRPSQIARRVAYSLGLTRNACVATTPWGLPITFDPGELHGRAMLTLGLSDLRVNEMISRLIRPGDTVIDIGANIGIMTSLMAVRAGPAGAVYAFEPHPETRARLEANVAAWMAHDQQVAPVSVLPYAVSSTAGAAQLIEPSQFSRNSGVATLERSARDGATDRQHVDIQRIKFDEWAEDLASIRLVKIDVEGHEDSVFDGMLESIQNKKVDFIIFEEMRAFPSPATERLREYGCGCYIIDRTFWGLDLQDIRKSPQRLQGEATNILAVRNNDDMQDVPQCGWRCLR